MGTAERNAALWGPQAEDWAELQEKQVRPLYDDVLTRYVKKGMAVLDAGCGAGGFVAMAVAAGAVVSAFDGTPELLAIAKRRSPQATLSLADLETVPFADESFDLVTGFNSFQYASDPARALSEARRVARRGAHVLVATWGRAEDCEAAGHLAALRPLLPPPPPGAGGPFALSDETLLRGLLEKAGLTPLEVRDVSCPMIYADDESALRALMSAGPVVLAVRTSGEEKTRKALLEGIAAYRTQSGGYRMENKFRYCLGRR